MISLSDVISNKAVISWDIYEFILKLMPDIRHFVIYGNFLRLIMGTFFHNVILSRYAAILFKKQKYVSGQHRVNLKIVCKENYKYEVQEKSPANQAVTMQQLAEEYWR